MTMKKKTTRRAAAAKGAVSDAWDKLEQIFEHRVAAVLNSLQIPTHADVHELSERVDELTRMVTELSEARPKAPGSARRSRAGAKKKPARRRTAKAGKSDTKA